MFASLVNDYLAGRVPLRELQNAVNAIWLDEMAVLPDERDLAELVELRVSELTSGYIDESALRSELGEYLFGTDTEYVAVDFTDAVGVNQWPVRTRQTSLSDLQELRVAYG